MLFVLFWAAFVGAGPIVTWDTTVNSVDSQFMSAVALGNISAISAFLARRGRTRPTSLMIDQTFLRVALLDEATALSIILNPDALLRVKTVNAGVALATRMRRRAIVRAFIDRYRRVITATTRATALEFAARYGDIDMAEMLVDLNRPVFADDKPLVDAVWEAFTYGRVSTVLMLLGKLVERDTATTRALVAQVLVDARNTKQLSMHDAVVSFALWHRFKIADL
jgi:hypothetical protein